MRFDSIVLWILNFSFITIDMSCVFSNCFILISGKRDKTWYEKEWSRFSVKVQKIPVDKDVYSRNRKQESENDKYLGIWSKYIR